MNNNLPYGIEIYKDVVSSKQCKGVISYYETQPKEITKNRIHGKKSTFGEVRITDDIMLNDGLLKLIYKKISAHINKYLDKHIVHDEFRKMLQEGCFTLEPRLKKYNPDDEFPLHSDDSTILASTRKFAYILYLNKDFNGGATLFKSGVKEIAKITPITGSLVIFPVHSIFMHEGENIIKGSKYILNGFANIIVSQATPSLPQKNINKMDYVNIEINQLTDLLRKAGLAVYGGRAVNKPLV